MKNIPAFILIMIALLPVTTSGQKHTYQLTGFIGVQGGESFTYKLNLQEGEDGTIKGTAATYTDPKRDVMATLTVSLDRAQRTLTIKEQNIVANNGFKSQALICLVEAVLTYDDREKKLYGPLITKTAGNGAECSKGSITFLNKEELDILFAIPTSAEVARQIPPAPEKPKIDPSKSVKVVYDTLPKSAPVVWKKRPENITEGRDKTYIWHTDTVLIDIWDGNTIDGDRITISYNGTEVLKDYVLTANKKRISLPLGGNELNILTIEARNEGGDPPNTANLLLTDGTTTYDIIAHNPTGKRAVIMISKE